MILTTLCYIEQNGCYLMLHRNKKKNDINQGKWIGVGGKFEANETPEECLLREVKEETGLTLTNYTFHGIVTFQADALEAEDMYLYTADGFTGELSDCSEGELCWVKKEEVMSLSLWEGDNIFLRRMLEDDAPFYLYLRYEEDKLVETIWKD